MLKGSYFTVHEVQGLFAQWLLDKGMCTLGIVRDSGTKQKAHPFRCTDGSPLSAS